MVLAVHVLVGQHDLLVGVPQLLNGHAHGVLALAHQLGRHIGADGDFEEGRYWHGRHRGAEEGPRDADAGRGNRAGAATSRRAWSAAALASFTSRRADARSLSASTCCSRASASTSYRSGRRIRARPPVSRCLRTTARRWRSRRWPRSRTPATTSRRPSP